MGTTQNSLVLEAMVEVLKKQKGNFSNISPIYLSTQALVLFIGGKIIEYQTPCAKITIANYPKDLFP